MKVRREGALLSEEAPRTGAELTELPQKDGWGRRLLRADKLVRNLAVVGAMLLTLGPDGAVSAPKLLDSGSNLYLSDIDASRPGEALLGGALGGQAVVMRLSPP